MVPYLDDFAVIGPPTRAHPGSGAPGRARRHRSRAQVRFHATPAIRAPWVPGSTRHTGLYSAAACRYPTAWRSATAGAHAGPGTSRTTGRLLSFRLAHAPDAHRARLECPLEWAP